MLILEDDVRVGNVSIEETLRRIPPNVAEQMMQTVIGLIPRLVLLGPEVEAGDGQGRRGRDIGGEHDHDDLPVPDALHLDDAGDGNVPDPTVGVAFPCSDVASRVDECRNLWTARPRAGSMRQRPWRHNGMHHCAGPSRRRWPSQDHRT
jgi:hypothetical protein